MENDAASLKAVQERIQALAFAPALSGQIEISSLNSSGLTLQAKNKFVRDWVRENYLDLITREVSSVLGTRVPIDIIVAPEGIAQGLESPAEPLPSSEEARVSQTGINPRYTFESFVIGSSNQFAHAAAQSVSSLQSKAYNPLYIYGGVGLGKTHLLNAVGNQILKNSPDTRILAISGEKFVNELIHSLRFEKMAAFRKKYREGCDLLLVDDVQFIGGKEKSQEEFFHTFNQLHDTTKQIVLTSDRVPREIPGLEDRLRSRFEWGLIADISAPDLETRVAILKKKAEADDIPLSNEVALYLATHITANVRELEGALIRVNAFSSLTQTPITLQLVKDILKNVIGGIGRVLTVEQVQKIVSDYFGVRVIDLTGKRRTRSFANPRQIAMYLCRKHVKASYPEIGNRFGGKDHSTVVHAVSKIEKRLQEDSDLKDQVSFIEQQLTA